MNIALKSEIEKLNVQLQGNEYRISLLEEQVDKDKKKQKTSELRIDRMREQLETETRLKLEAWAKIAQMQAALRAPVPPPSLSRPIPCPYESSLLSSDESGPSSAKAKVRPAARSSGSVSAPKKPRKAAQPPPAQSSSARSPAPGSPAQSDDHQSDGEREAAAAKLRATGHSDNAVCPVQHCSFPLPGSGRWDRIVNAAHVTHHNEREEYIHKDVAKAIRAPQKIKLTAQIMRKGVAWLKARQTACKAETKETRKTLGGLVLWKPKEAPADDDGEEDDTAQ